MRKTPTRETRYLQPANEYLFEKEKIILIYRAYLFIRVPFYQHLHLIVTDPHKLSIVIPLLQKMKLRLREVRSWSQPSQWQSPKAVIFCLRAFWVSSPRRLCSLFAVGFGCFHMWVNLAQPTTRQTEAPASDRALSKYARSGLSHMLWLGCTLPQWISSMEARQWQR